MLDKLKLILGIKAEDTEKDGVLSFSLETVEDEVKNYCNIDEIPATLENTVVRIAADLCRSEGYGQANAPRVAQSVSRGDVTINYGSGKATAEIGGVKSFIDDYKTQLQAFRKLRR